MAEQRSFTFRRLTAEDANEVADISFGAFRDPVDAPWSDVDFRSKLQQPQFFSGWLALAGHQPIGFLLFQDHIEALEILKLAVLPKHQRCGIASKLLTLCIETFPAREVWLEVASTNERALSLYKSFGFELGRRLVRAFTNPRNLSQTADALVLCRPALLPFR